MTSVKGVSDADSDHYKNKEQIGACMTQTLSFLWTCSSIYEKGIK